MAVSPGNDRYLPALTGLRAVAACLVFLHHYNPASPGTLPWHVFNQGYIGVAVFFVLSGFLIYHRYADAYFGQQEWWWRRYLQNRFARVYPLYAVLLFLMVGVAAWRGQPMPFPVFLLNLTLLKGFFTSYVFSGIAQSWSLTVEGCFYLLAPLLFFLLSRWGAFWLVFTLLVTGLLLGAVGRQLMWHGLFGTPSFVLFYLFFGRSFEFVVGMWLARCWHQGRLPVVPYPVVTGLFVVVACVAWQAGLSAYTTNRSVLIISEVMAYNLALPASIGLLFVGMLTRSSGIGRVLSSPVMQVLGRSAYAFYLIHIGLFSSALRSAGVTNRWLLFGLLVGISLLLYRFVEAPLQRLLRADTPKTPIY